MKRERKRKKGSVKWKNRVNRIVSDECTVRNICYRPSESPNYDLLEEIFAPVIYRYFIFVRTEFIDILFSYSQINKSMHKIERLT